jgi:hypothetical protein
LGDMILLVNAPSPRIIHVFKTNHLTPCALKCDARSGISFELSRWRTPSNLLFLYFLSGGKFALKARTRVETRHIPY